MDTMTAHARIANLDTAILPDLWRRRTHLSHDEMVSMYHLVRGALRAYHPLELQSLREDKEELVAQFIYAKVLRLEPGHSTAKSCAESAPSNNYAICAYFRRYLIDCLRSASHQRNVSMEVSGIDQQVDEHAQAIEDPVRSVLLQYGLDESRVRRMARCFISALDRHERVVLAGTLGRDSGRKGGALANRGRAQGAFVSLSCSETGRGVAENGASRGFRCNEDRLLVERHCRHPDQRRESAGDAGRARSARSRVS